MAATIEKFDIIIVGAGIAGSALACALASSSLSIAIINAQALSDTRPQQNNSVGGFDSRVSALTAASQAFLDSLDVWPAIAQQRVSPYRSMHVWDAEGTAYIDFSAEEINRSTLGHIVENRVTVAALVARLQQCSNVQLIAPAIFKQLTDCENGREILLEDGRIFQAPLVIAADGANSLIRESGGFFTREWDYGHHAIVATVQTQKTHGLTAWQRFLPEGPLAFLPLHSADPEKHFCSIVWSAIPQYAENLMGMSDELFSVELAKAFEFRLGDILAVGPRSSFPLRQRHSVDYIKPGLALVGDAAHTIHPLAGQGINLGLSDAKVLAQEIMRGQNRHLDLGEFSILQRYQRRRKGENLAVMASMEGFKRLFENTSLPLRWLRNTGMRAVDNSTFVKNKIMRVVTGL